MLEVLKTFRKQGKKFYNMYKNIKVFTLLVLIILLLEILLNYISMTGKSYIH